MSNIINLKVTGMTCNPCLMHTTKAFEGVDGVDNVSLEEGSATVTGTADTNDLIAAVKEAGYEAEIS
jgi:copper chaperone CopZ